MESLKILIFYSWVASFLTGVSKVTPARDKRAGQVLQVSFLLRFSVRAKKIL